MRTREASIRVASLVLGSLAAAFVLAFGAQPAGAQLPVVDCLAPNDIPEAVFDAVDDEYPLDTFSQSTCESAAKATAQGCKKTVRTAAKCRNLVNAATTQASLLACALLTDSSARKACESAGKNDLKMLDAEVKDQATEGAASCADDVPPEILGVCASSM